MTESATSKAGNEGDAAAAEQSPLAAVGALMDERRKYESWLGALEARRAATPERVFLRVHADYTTRRDAVAEQLASHAAALRAELESGEQRVAGLSAEEETARDERDEAELRAHVGELEGAEWERVALAADERLGALRERRSTLESAQARTRELLAEAERPSVSTAGEAVAVATRESDPAPAPVSVASTLVVEPGLAGEPEVDAAAPSPSAEPVADAGLDSEPLDIPLELPPAVIAAEAALNEPDEPRASASFDEIAFVSSVVDTPAGSVDAAPTDQADETSRRDSFALRAHDDQIVNLDRDDASALAGAQPGRTGAPLASNVTGSAPIIIAAASGEASKTLKCAECSAMNYPTEWYCERCGAELASL